MNIIDFWRTHKIRVEQAFSKFEQLEMKQWHKMQLEILQRLDLFFFHPSPLNAECMRLDIDVSISGFDGILCAFILVSSSVVFADVDGR